MRSLEIVQDSAKPGPTSVVPGLNSTKRLKIVCAEEFMLVPSVTNCGLKEDGLPSIQKMKLSAACANIGNNNAANNNFFIKFSPLNIMKTLVMWHRNEPATTLQCI